MARRTDAGGARARGFMIMCGICGQYHFLDDRPAEPQMIRAMRDSMAHRGPDDRGLHLDGNLGLGFRRLSIIDLSSGRQPMSNAARTVWVVFNGEIYNFRELRRELESHGHRFRSRSDTEVLVHGYQQWGQNVLDHLNGMFGLALWDAPRRTLMLARDRAGIKQLYYTFEGGSLAFGSEIRPLRVAHEDRFDVDPVAVSLFLRYRFTPSPLTILKGVRKLAPGSRLVVSPAGVREERWLTATSASSVRPPTPGEARERLHELLARAVERQLVSDVPLGVLLSGGIDSALLTRFMAEAGTRARTFTVGFGAEFADDELEDAASTARLLGTPNHRVRIDRAEFERALPKVVEILEEPIASPSIVPMYFVSESARRHVKVALMGQGPDELFGGYRRHLGVRYAHLWRTLVERMNGTAGWGIRAFARGEGLHRALYALGESDRIRMYQKVLSIIPHDQLQSLFHEGLLDETSDDRILDCWDGMCATARRLDPLSGLQYLELRSTLPDELLMYADKLSMHHGLEVRVPFLDQDVIDYAESLPGSLKVRHGERKWLYRRVCRESLPERILRRPKRGFAANVVSDWFAESLMGKLEETLLCDHSLIYRLLDPRVVRRMAREHRERRRDHHKILFSLIVLEEWMRHRAETGALTAA